MVGMQGALDALTARVDEQDRTINANRAEAMTKEEVRKRGGIGHHPTTPRYAA